MSTFNSRTLDINDSDASTVYAFVERYTGREYQHTFIHKWGEETRMVREVADDTNR